MDLGNSPTHNGGVWLQTIRTASQAKEQAEKRQEIRKKSLLLLVHQYLQEHGYEEAAVSLHQEARLNTELYSVCENTDLQTLLRQYEEWHVIKFHRFPRFAKRNTGPRPTPKPHRCDLHTDDDSLPKDFAAGRKSPFLRRRSVGPKPGLKTAAIGRATSNPNIADETNNGPKGRLTKGSVYKDNRKSEELGRTTAARRGTLRSPNDEKKDSNKSSSDTDSDRGGNLAPIRPNRMAMIRDYTRLEENMGDIGKKNVVKKQKENTKQEGSPEDDSDELWDDKLVKPPNVIPSFTGEYKDLANIIDREILIDNPCVSWSEIKGVEEAKRLVKEAVVYPLKYPQLFVGRFKPWRGILLYGPPGTGKTLLAKAVATECRTTFFNISATSLVSKWRGDSEKLVRVLFEMARFHAPSTIFVDEIDALMGCRQGEQEHEASRRMKTQLLVELDGLTKSNDHVFLLAASNIPWELDPAMLRRLEKRILVPLPEQEAREAMFQHHLPEVLPDLEEAGQRVNTILDYEELAKKTDGYSGSDLQIVCRETAMSCLRKVFKILEENTENEDIPNLQLESITMDDVATALERTKPSQHDVEKYTEWHKKFGSA